MDFWKSEALPPSVGWSFWGSVGRLPPEKKFWGGVSPPVGKRLETPLRYTAPCAHHRRANVCADPRLPCAGTGESLQSLFSSKNFNSQALTDRPAIAMTISGTETTNFEIRQKTRSVGFTMSWSRLSSNRNSLLILLVCSVHPLVAMSLARKCVIRKSVILFLSEIAL